jgi:hypothetical protein
MQRTTREVWKKRIAEWKASGLSAKEFAAKLGVKPRTLAWWGWNLGAPKSPRRGLRGSAKKSTAITRAMPMATSISPMTFVEMTVPISTDALEVILPSTLRVCVRPGFHDATLGRLLDVLEQRR